MESSLNEINLGRIDAESDEQLEAYFVETGAVDGVRSGKQLILGRKGSGKTALFAHIRDAFSHRTVDLELTNYFLKLTSCCGKRASQRRMHTLLHWNC